MYPKSKWEIPPHFLVPLKLLFTKIIPVELSIKYLLSVKAWVMKRSGGGRSEPKIKNGRWNTNEDFCRGFYSAVRILWISLGFGGAVPKRTELMTKAQNNIGSFLQFHQSEWKKSSRARSRTWQRVYRQWHLPLGDMNFSVAYNNE